MFYYLIFFIISLFAFTDFYKINKVTIMWLFVIILGLMAGLRGSDVGADYIEYVSIFNAVSTIEEILDYKINYSEVHGEPLYLLINSIIKIFTPNPVYLFLFISFLAVSINLYHYKKYSPYFVLSICIYFSHIYLYKDMTQIRTGVAAAILLFSIPYIYYHKFFKFSFVVILASMFHYGAFIMYLVYMFYKLKFTKQRVYFVLFISLFIGHFISWVHVFLDMLYNIHLLPQAVKDYVGWTYDYQLSILNPITMKQVLVIVLLTMYYNILNNYW